MINFSLLTTAQSTIALDDLWQQALPAVIERLGECGYAVHQDAAAEAAAAQMVPHEYRLTPGGTMTAAPDKVTGSINFSLDGPRFGIVSAGHDTDPVLWMQLVSLGVGFGETYTVLPRVSDPADRGTPG